MSEKTCILVKPDGVSTRRVGSVVDRLERAGLRLAAMKMTRLAPADAERFYQEHKGKVFYDPLVRFMTSAPIVAMVWEGPAAVSTARSLMGATNSKEAVAGTLRGDFGTDNRYNLVHGSDSLTAAAREIAFFFKPQEIYSYGQNDWKN